MADKKILITGISGFLGTNLASALASQSDVRIFGHSRQPSSSAPVINGQRVSMLRNLDAEQLNAHQIDCVIHLAGIAHDLSGHYTASDYFAVNEGNTCRLYDAFLQSAASQFIFASSIKAAVDTSSVAVSESVACNPTTPYGQSKRNAELYLLRQPSVEGKEFHILRPCMVHGPGNKGNLNLLYKFVRTGLPYPLAAFSNRRSFLSVNNFCFVVDQLIRQRPGSGIFHLADDGFISTLDLYRLIAKETGKKARTLSVPPSLIGLAAALTGMKRRITKLTEDMIVSNKKIVETIGRPLPESLYDGLVRTIRSFDEN